MTLAALKSLIFLINTLFGLYIAAILLRFLLQWVKADFYNPLCQFLIKITNPLLRPLRRVIPGFFGLDFAAIVLMFALEIVNLLIVALLLRYPPGFFILVVAVIKLVLLTLNVLFFTIIVRVVLSWLGPQQYNAMTVVFIQLTEPLLAPFRRWIPQIGGIDISPMVVLILLQVIAIFLQTLVVGWS